MKTNIHFWTCLTQFFLEWEMFQTNILEKTETHLMFSDFFQKPCHLWDDVEKQCRVEQATDDSVVHAHCMLDT
jgi:hypothetical protein